MPYEDGHDAIVAEIRTAISETSDLRYVYDIPPGSIRTYPCVVFFGDGGRFDFTFGATVTGEQHHEEYLKILLQDQDIEDGMNRLQDLKTVVLDKIRSVGNLNGYGEIYHVEWSPPSRHTYGKTYYLGQAIRIQFLLNSAT